MSIGLRQRRKSGWESTFKFNCKALENRFPIFNQHRLLFRNIIKGATGYAYLCGKTRESLEKTAALLDDRFSFQLPTSHRHDQDPTNFR
ncbi:hypothetical protein [Synechococcus sp. PCC 7502]|uniref:hypothetical protein n=1 Tax=Synechococcus sp. PCC 7502 TaxID=1173263 RepID=UPI0002DF3F20|nr:hypothetical protein [Synechococcus sp. PCC 7502]